MWVTPATCRVGEDGYVVELPAITVKSDNGRCTVVPSASTQWAAVSTCVGSRIEPPQAPTMLLPFSSNFASTYTCQGNWEIDASWPPTMKGTSGCSPAAATPGEGASRARTDM